MLNLLFGTVAVIYILFGIPLAKSPYDDYMKKTPITFFKYTKKPKDWVMYIYFPIIIVFSIMSAIQQRNLQRAKDKKLALLKKEQEGKINLIKSNFFCNDACAIENFETKIKNSIGLFDECFYIALYSLSQTNDESRTFIFSEVNNVLEKNDIKLDQGKINQLSFDILYFHLSKKYNEPYEYLIVRLRKAGYKVRVNFLGKDYSLHNILCNYKGNEASCPKTCENCAIKLFENANDLVDTNITESINLLEKAISKEPNYPEAWCFLGYCNYKIGNYNVALKAYNKAISLDESYGAALWGCAKTLSSLGRNREAMFMLYNLTNYYNYADANTAINKMREDSISPIEIVLNAEENLQKKLLSISHILGFVKTEKIIKNQDVDNLYEQLFSDFFDYLVEYYKGKIEINKIIKFNAEFLMLAGMAASKLWNENKSMFYNNTLVDILASKKGFFAMDEYCCDILSIPYIPDKGNILSPCLSSMVETAIITFYDILEQVHEIKHIKYVVHDIAMCFFDLGVSIIEEKILNKDSSCVTLKFPSNRDLLKVRLKTMETDPKIKTAKRSEGAMCYSIKIPENSVYKCAHCGKIFSAYPQDECRRYYNYIRNLGIDCRSEIWCRECCIQNKLDIYKYADSGFVLYIRVDKSENYRLSVVSKYELRILYQFFKNENMYDGGMMVGTSFVGEHTDVVKKILGF